MPPKKSRFFHTIEATVATQLGCAPSQVAHSAIFEAAKNPVRLRTQLGCAKSKMWCEKHAKTHEFTCFDSVSDYI